MTIAASGHPRQADERAPSWLAKVFALNPAGLNWGRGVLMLDLVLVPWVVLVATGHDQYVFSAVFAVVWAAAEDPGGSFGSRALHLALFGLLGAAVTALGFWIATTAWGWQVLAVTAVTLVAGLLAVFGARRFVGAMLLKPRARSAVTPGARRSPGRGGRCCISSSRSSVG